VKLFNQISVGFLGMIFLLSSTGIIIFESHCSCTGNEQISLFVTPETCETNFHEHHSHNSLGFETETNAHECHECSSHTQDCGCESPDVKYLKLVNQLIDEEVEFVKVHPVKIFVAKALINFSFSDVFTLIESKEYYIDPPKKIISSLDFLVQIHQLKIPVLA
jgi:hypothetical protein